MKENISFVKGVGKKTLEYFNKANIFSKEDLVLTLPSRYKYYYVEDINNVLEERVISIKAKVLSLSAIKKIRRNLSTLIYSLDVNGIKIRAIIFGQDYLKYSLKKNMDVVFYGLYRPASHEIVVRECFTDSFIEKIECIYPIKNITSNAIKKILKDIYSTSKTNYLDEIPSYLREKYKLLEYNDYIYKSHFPSSYNDLKEINRRTKYTIYLKYSLKLNCLRYYLDTKNKTEKIFDDKIISDFISKLDYTLTSDQLKAIEECFSDLRSNRIMNRLVQGDVGSGKSIVALICAYAVVLSGYQVALMVPSEVLSTQHYDYFTNLLPNINIELLNSSIKSASKKRIIDNIAYGNTQIVIGTQSLIEDNIKFKNLGLTIVDEQHKFGVNERAKLINKGDFCDSLFLTATPIPRTLGISRYGDLDISSIYTKPSGRKKVLTKVVHNDDIDFINNAIIKNVSKGHQVFVVVPVINESENLDLINVNDKYEELKELNPSIRFGILHGDMKDDNKTSVMELFKNHEIDVLVSTTVIEVGIDIKDATLMIIYNAERFGLSSLHQLRGRVGRNDYQSGCLLATNNINNDRLKLMEECYDCFTLSEFDLKQRGPGDILGYRQSGFLDLDFENDNNVFKIAIKDAKEIYDDYLKGNKHQIVENIIKELYLSNTKLN